MSLKEVIKIKAASSNDWALTPHVRQKERQLWYRYWRSVDKALNFQDYRTLCEWVKYYFLCAVGYVALEMTYWK